MKLTFFSLIFQLLVKKLNNKIRNKVANMSVVAFQIHSKQLLKKHQICYFKPIVWGRVLRSLENSFENHGEIFSPDCLVLALFSISIDLYNIAQHA